MYLYLLVKEMLAAASDESLSAEEVRAALRSAAVSIDKFEMMRDRALLDAVNGIRAVTGAAPLKDEQAFREWLVSHEFYQAERPPKGGTETKRDGI